MQRLVLLMIIGLFSVTPAWAQTEAMTIARSLVEKGDLSGMIGDAMFPSTMPLPPKHKAVIMGVVQETLTAQVVRDAIVSGLVRNFTLDELKAMQSFYTSPIGQSVNRKMPNFVAEVTQVIQSEFQKRMNAHMQSRKTAPMPGVSNNPATATPNAVR